MSDIRLLSITITNFKGSRTTRTFDFHGLDASCFADNECGKTRLVDSVLWLLFGRDSLNQADFEIKDRKPGGDQWHATPHEVEAVFSVDGSESSFKKIFSEKWTKKRGSATAEFTGHTVDHFFDGVPVKQGEFNAAVSALVGFSGDNTKFKLLTNPRFFSESMKWQERRALLLEICGDVTDAQVIEANPNLAELPAILGKRSIDDHRKVLAGRKREINQTLENIPARIDEQNRSIVPAPEDPHLTKTNIEHFEQVRAGHEKKRAELQAKLETLSSSGQIAEKTKELRDVEGKIITLETEAHRVLSAAQQARRNAIQSAKDALRPFENKRTDLQFSLDRKRREKTTFETEAERLRNDWKNLKRQEFTAAGVCPTCGQDIPKEQIEKATAEFNRRKAEKMEGLNASGMRTKQELESIEKAIAEIVSSLEQNTRDLEAAVEAVRQAQVIPEPVITLPSEHSTLSDQKKWIAEQIESIKRSGAPEADGIRAEIETENQAIADATGKIQIQRGELLRIEGNAKCRARIQELKNQERELAGEFEKVERELFLCEEFVRAKTGMLETSVNSRFEHVGFKLFEPQVNGGISETCEITVDGVPYSSANNASRINAGIEVCNVLSDHYGVRLPMFVDNAEAVSRLLPSRGQQIRLYVSQPDKDLRIVLDQSSAARAA